MQGYEPVGGRPPTPESTRWTGSLTTALAHTPRAASDTDHKVSEPDICRQVVGRVPFCVPQLNDKEARHAA